MSLGRELKDFTAAFGSGYQLMQRDDYINAVRDNRKKGKAGPDSDPRMADLNKQYGVGGAKTSSWFSRNIAPIFGGGSKASAGNIGVSDGFNGAGSNSNADDPSYSDPAAINDDWSFADGGVAPDEPPPQQVAEAPPPQQGGVPQSMGDQTRTAAYDPTTEGPPVGAVPAPAQAVTPGGMQPTAVPQNDRSQPGNLQGGAPDQESLLSKAIDGGLQYAIHTFHLKGDGAALPGTDKHQEGGRRAFLAGMGTPPAEDIQNMDRAVAAKVGSTGLPKEVEYGFKRLELIYRYYSENGETDKANKAAFELMQYGATAASKYGTQALGQIRAGDTTGAIKSVVAGYDHLPDGQHIVVQGNTAIVMDTKTGQPVQQIPFTGKDLFNTALGLSNKSLYWDVLSRRASAVPSARLDAAAQTKAEMDAARLKLIKLRTEKLAAKGTGGGGPAGPSPGLQKLLDSLPGHAAPAAASVPSSGGAPTGEGGGEPGEFPEDNDGGTGSNADPERVARGQATTMPVAAKTHDGYPARQNPDGSYSTELSITVTNPNINGGKPTNIPSLWGGKELDEAGAVDAAVKSGRTFQSFPSVDTAVAAAVKRSAAGGAAAPSPDDVPNRLVHNGRYADLEQTNPIPPPVTAPYNVPKPEPTVEPWKDPPGLTEALAGLSKSERKLVTDEIARRKSEIAKQQASDLRAVSDWTKDRNEHLKTQENDRKEWVKDQENTRKEHYGRIEKEAKELYGQVHTEASADEAKRRVGDKIDELVKSVTTTDGKPNERAGKTIFDDATVPKEQFATHLNDLKNIAVSVSASNPQARDAESAVRLTADLVRSGKDPTDRPYVPAGRDAAGNIVVVLRNKDGEPNGQSVHLKPHTYTLIQAQIKDRYERLKTAAEAPPPKPSFMERALKTAGTIAREAPDYLVSSPKAVDGGLAATADRLGKVGPRINQAVIGGVQRGFTPSGNNNDPTLPPLGN